MPFTRTNDASKTAAITIIPEWVKALFGFFRG